MRKCISYIAFSLLTIKVTFSQSVRYLPADFRGAQKIQVNAEITAQKSPSGFGNLQEFRPDPQRSRHIFKEERNTRWFYFDIPFSGSLTFELTPYRVRDDYDWMLFKYTPGLENEILLGKAMPIRSNNSRNNPHARSITGMKEGFSDLYTHPGPNIAFSRAVDASKGERYYLIVDNIYEKGQGFKLKLELKPTFRSPYRIVEGYVRDRSTGQPLQGEVVFEDDSTSFQITRITTDAAGYYKVLLPANRPVNATAIHPSYLPGTEDFKILTEKLTLDFGLDSIRAGNKVILYNIHFQPNRDIILAQSSAELDRLLEFLRRESEWNIKIIGHSNNNVFADASYLQKLSFNRAVSVKRHLVRNGIPASRISCTGMGGKVPLIDTRDPEEGLKNLRVEIVLEKSPGKPGRLRG